ncbi:MAG: hypothetical protein AAFO74_00130 [Pseudomonadota bacterium]
MINTVFGVIAGMFAIGIYQKKPSPTKMEARLADLPVWAEPGLPALLILVFLSNFIDMPGLLALPHFILSYAGLIIHEAGHFYVSWANEFIHAFGGTLFQLGVPLTLALIFYSKRHFRWAALFIAWLSVGFFSASVYSADAVDRVLPLLGGNIDGHDWHTMLGLLDWFEHTQLISDIFWSCGVVSGLLSILLYSAQSFRRWRLIRLKHQKLS